jgi:hypothetical protein
MTAIVSRHIAISVPAEIYPEMKAEFDRIIQQISFLPSKRPRKRVLEISTIRRRYICQFFGPTETSANQYNSS